jgi:hypothetical protein
MDETTTDTAPVEAPAAEAPADEAPPAEAAPEAPPYDWRKALEEAPADELRRHPKFAGIVGSEKQFWQKQWDDQKQAEADAKAKAQAEADLRELAQRNPVEFADKWLSSEEARQQQERLTALESSARQDVAKSIGAAFQAFPEWEDLMRDPNALARLATAMEGKPPDQVLAAWNAAAVDLMVERRAAAKAQADLAARLQAERTAWETEAAAQGFVASDRPDLVRGGRIGTADPEPDFLANPKEWNAWYRRNASGAA